MVLLKKHRTFGSLGRMKPTERSRYIIAPEKTADPELVADYLYSNPEGKLMEGGSETVGVAGVKRNLFVR